MRFLSLLTLMGVSQLSAMADMWRSKVVGLTSCPEKGKVGSTEVGY